MKIKSAELECTVLDPTAYPRSGLPEVAVSGRSNVGKSTLLNMLLTRRNLARVSREPGKTRTVNFFLINGSFYLVDLPGYGYAKVSKKEREGWKRAVGGYIGGREHLRGVIQLIDVRREPTADDLAMIQRTVDAGRALLAVFTKSDKTGRGRRNGVIAGFRECFEGLTVGPAGREAPGGGPFDIPLVFSSSSTGEGKDAIWQWIKTVI